MGDDAIAVQKKYGIKKRALLCTGRRRNWWSCWLLKEGMLQSVCVCVCVCVWCVCVCVCRRSWQVGPCALERLSHVTTYCHKFLINLSIITKICNYCLPLI